jgi:hypothetical protein
MAYGTLEGQKRIQDFVNRFINCIQSQNGHGLAALMAISNSQFRDSVGSALDNVKVLLFLSFSVPSFWSFLLPAL